MTPHRRAAILAMSLVVAAFGVTDAHAAAPQVGASPILGGDPYSWAPISVTPGSNNRVVKAVQGQSITLTGFPATSIVESTNASVASPVQGTTSDATTVDGVTTPGATTDPGLQTGDIGAARVIVWDGPYATGAASPIITFIVQVSSVNGKDSMLDRKPLLLAGTEKAVALNETGERLAWDLPRYRVTSDNESVVTPTGYAGAQTLTAVGYGTAHVIVSKGGERLAKAIVTVSRAPRFEFRLAKPRVIAAETGEIVNVSGRLARPGPMTAIVLEVCAYHVTPWTRLGCTTLTPAGSFVIPAKAMPGTSVIEYRDGGGKGSKYFAIDIRPAG